MPHAGVKLHDHHQPTASLAGVADQMSLWESKSALIREARLQRDLRHRLQAGAFVTTGSVISLNIGTSMRGGCTFLFEQRVERVGVRTEFTKMLSGATLGKLAPAPAFVVTKDARPLQVSHDRRIAVRWRLCVHKKRRQHFRQGVGCGGSFCG